LRLKNNILSITLKKIAIRLGSLPRLLAIFFVRLYQIFLSPLLGTNCRFYPSCSRYAIECFHKKTFFSALSLTIYRILRCNPLGGQGVDLLPEESHQTKSLQNRGHQNIRVGKK
jgi:putative membrane protein insertion efficiency factor